MFRDFLLGSSAIAAVLVCLILAGSDVPFSEGAKICYSPQNCSTVSACVVNYNDSLVLKSSLPASGTWYYGDASVLNCSFRNECILDDLQYKMSGVYSYAVNDQLCKIKVSVRSPPYLSLCLSPSYHCGDLKKSCNQFEVKSPLVNNNHPIVRTTVEGNDVAEMTAKWFHNCSGYLMNCTNTSTPWSCGKRLLSLNTVEFYLKLPLLLQYDMAGDYKVVVANDLGKTTAHTKFTIDQCSPQRNLPDVIQPHNGVGNQTVIDGLPTDVMFEVLTVPDADLYICNDQLHDSNYKSTCCSKCPYNVNGNCAQLKDRSSWNISVKQVERQVCLSHRTVTVHIPATGDYKPETIYLSYWVNGHDRSVDDFAHITIIKGEPINTHYTTIIGTAVAVSLMAVVLAGVALVVIVIKIRRVHQRKPYNDLDKMDDKDVNVQDGSHSLENETQGNQNRQLIEDKENPKSLSCYGSMTNTTEEDVDTIFSDYEAELYLTATLDSEKRFI